MKKTVKFQGHESAAACMMMENGRCELVSYTTVVAVISPDGWLHVNGLYSKTTMKHIGWFMKEHGLTYQTAKALVHLHKDINLDTGELRDWE